MALVKLQQTDCGVLHITLNDPKRRNALGIEMFTEFDLALLKCRDDTRCVLLAGEGSVFCSGFDMKACVDDLSMLKTYIVRLSKLIRSLRRLPVPVVVAAHGAAIAGGCALLTGCDFIVGSSDGTYGYPVHQLGISPAVTIPTLFQKLGEGRARSMILGGELMHGVDALACGLLTHVEETAQDTKSRAIAFAESLAQKSPHALQTTKRWLNELDGSLEDDWFDAPAMHSSSSIGDETQELLNQSWKK
jgi:methylglutaconyl-CoA hydratase